MITIHRIFARFAMAAAAAAMVFAGNFGCIRQPAYVNGPQLAAPSGPGAPTTNGNTFTTAVAIGGALDFSASATDPNAGDTLTLTATVTGGSLTAAQAGFATAFPANVSGPSPQTLDFSGTAAMVGTIEITVVADDGSNSDAWVMTIHISSPPNLGTPSGPGTVTGTTPSFATTVPAAMPLNFSITATDADAGETLTVSASVTGGSLTTAQAGFTTAVPASNNGPSPVTVALTGTAGTMAGTIQLTVTARDSAGLSVSVTLTITIQTEAPSFTNAPSTVAVVGQPWNFTPTATGIPAPTISVSDQPTWLAWNGNTLSGTPAPVDQGTTATITFTANNGVSPAATLPFTIAVCDWTAGPHGTNNDLYGVWGSSPSDVFAVGLNGTIEYFDGNSWSAMTSGTSQTLRGVCGTAGNVFAVGFNGTVRRFNGTTWSAMTSGTAQDLWGTWGTQGNVFAVGANGTIRRYNGTAWNGMTSGTAQVLRGVWGTSLSNVFAVGYGGTILRYNGAAWASMSSGTAQNLYHVWGNAANDVFAVGENGTILHYNGSTWSAMSSGTAQNLVGVWGSSANDVFTVGTSGTVLHFDGATWSPMNHPNSSNLTAVWGSSATDVFAVGWGYTSHFGP